MARRENELFIGKEYLNKEGASIKHIGLIKKYATVNVNKLADEKIKLIGLDLETDYKTAELKLLGFWNGTDYSYYLKNFLSVMFSKLKYCAYNRVSIAYWNRLDPFVLFKEFIKPLPEESKRIALERFGKIGGEFDRKLCEWSITPLVELEFRGYYFGIKNVIRSSIQFFIRKKDSDYLDTVWAYDIAQLYQSGLEREMMSRKDLYPYYSKVDKSAHLVDWQRFYNDRDYRVNKVLKSNELDSRAVYDLGNLIQDMIREAFGYYTNTLVSTGSIARSGLVADITNYYTSQGLDKKMAKGKINNDIKSIGIINYYDKWYKELGADKLKDFLCLSTEAYSGGYIEALEYGRVKEAYYSDIASAYPSIIAELYDLRGATITSGKGIPPKKAYSYCLIRGTVNIPDSIQIHPITIKHPLYTSTNIRATGNYIASYTIEEREFLEGLGATFSDEVWYNIETTGKPSPIAQAVIRFVELRAKQLAEGNSAQYVSKITANSLYGILFEAVDTYEENEDREVTRVGYRSGEFFNPIYATIITSRTRLLISKACYNILDNGGKPLLIMTDSIFWKGTPEMISSEYVREKKTLGYFEKPERVTDLVLLGTGRYTYNKDGYIFSKNRGLNVSSLHAPEGVDVDGFNWSTALNMAVKEKSYMIKVKTRLLVSVGKVLHDGAYNVDDLGLVTEVDREVNIIAGLKKRIIDRKVQDITNLNKGTVKTVAYHLQSGMLGDSKPIDQSLPILRAEVMKKDVITSSARKLKTRNEAQKRYQKANYNKLYAKQKEKYEELKKYGYSAKERAKMSKWSNERILKKLKEDNKEVE